MIVGSRLPALVPTRAAAAPAPTPPAERKPQFDSFEEFFPYYLSQHRKPATRAMHFIGTTAALASGIAGVVTGNPWLVAAVPVLGYGFAWTSHFLIEHNKPATFGYPLYSFQADVKMYTEMARGNLWSGDPGPWPPQKP
jgi:hypothetical protein